MKSSSICDGFLVGCDGVVIRNNGAVAKQSCSRGYMVIGVTINGRKTTVSVHRLVAMEYCDGYSAGMQVNHKNGIKHDNRYENLEWVTPTQNMKHAFSAGLANSSGERNTMAKLDNKKVAQIRAMAKAGDSTSKISSMFGVHSATIRNVVTGKTWQREQNENT